MMQKAPNFAKNRAKAKLPPVAEAKLAADDGPADLEAALAPPMRASAIPLPTGPSDIPILPPGAAPILAPFKIAPIPLPIRPTDTGLTPDVGPTDEGLDRLLAPRGTVTKMFKGGLAYPVGDAAPASPSKIPRYEGAQASGDLLAAMSANDLAGVTTLLASHPDLAATARSARGTALCEAAMLDSPDLIGALVEAGADVNAGTLAWDAKSHSPVLHTPWSYACFHRKPRALKALGQLGADPNVPFVLSSNEPCLSACSANIDKIAGMPLIVELMLQAGADPNHRTAGNTTPVMTAATVGSIAAIRLLVAYGGDINAADDYDITPLISAVHGGSVELVEWLIGAGADVNWVRPTTDGLTALMVATQLSGDHVPATMKALLAAGADDTNVSSTDHLTAYSISAYFNSTIPIEVLLRHGPSAASAASLKAILTPEDLRYWLCAGAESGHLDLIRLALSFGASPDGTHPYNGRSALELAISNKQAAAQSLLLAEGASPFVAHQISRSQETARQLEISIRDLEPGKHLMIPDTAASELENTSEDFLGRTPMFFIARTGKIGLMDDLAAAGLKPSLQSVDAEGYTPLHSAAAFGRTQAVSWMLKAGADPAAETFAGKTPLEVAREWAAVYRAHSKAIKKHSAELAKIDRGKAYTFTDRLTVIAPELPPRARDLVDYDPPDYAGVAKALVEAGSPHGLSRAASKAWGYFQYTVYFLLFGLVFPALLIEGSLSSRVSFSETTVFLYSLWASPPSWTLRGIVWLGLGAIVLAPPVLLVLGELSAVQALGIGLVGLGMALTLRVLAKVWAEPRFQHLKKPRTKLRLNPFKHFKAAVTNMVAIILLAYEFVAQSSLAFLNSDDIPWPASARVLIDGIRLGSGLDVALLLDLIPKTPPAFLGFTPENSGDSGFVNFWLGVTALIGLWYVLASFTGASSYVMQAPSLSPATLDTQPAFRSRFRFVSPSFTSLVPGFGLLVPILSTSLFMVVINGLLTTFDCTGRSDGSFTLDADPAIACYTGPHAVMFPISVVAFVFYLVTALYIGLFFIEGDEDSNEDVLNVGRWTVLVQILQLLAIAVNVLFTSLLSPMLVVGIVGLSNAALTAAAISIKPIHHLGILNFWRILSFAGSTLAAAAVALAIHLDDPENDTPALLLYGGWAALAGIGLLGSLFVSDWSGFTAQPDAAAVAAAEEALLSKLKADGLSALPTGSVKSPAADTRRLLNQA